ncbi:cytochrome P450 4V2-like [Hydra vulgaris]|uniref:Cytochrome P450 4V2-like n=1 Tax=Hydra vulgaris TaxID=6087 RepID=A0ABM4CCD5_HYDVU
MFVAYSLLVVFCLYFVIKLFWKLWIYSYGLSTVPTPPTIPFFGNSLQLESDSVKFNKQLCEWSKVYGNVFCVWIGLRPTLFSSSVNFSEAILSSQEVLKKASIYDFLHDWLKTGLLTSTGNKWKLRRRLLTPSFHFSILNNFLKIFEEQGACLVEKLRIYAKTGKNVDIQVPIGLATLDIICETSMGVKLNAQSQPDSDYVTAINILSEEIPRRFKYPWLWPDIIYKHLSCGKRYYKALDVAHKLSLDVINERIKTRFQNESEVISDKNEADLRTVEKKFFLDLLLDIYKKGEIDTEGIQEEVDTFMFEGHDTTSSALSWILWLLGRYPQVQQKLHAEIDEVELAEGSLYEKVRNFKYLENIIKESMRIHPPVPLIGRHIEKDMVIDGQFIPKKSEIGVLVMMIHSSPEYWKDPYDFIPERFEQEDFVKRNPYIYIPFSAGPRNCIGQKFAMIEEKMLLYSIMKNFYVQSMQNENEILPSLDLIRKSVNGIIIKLTERQ